MNDSFDKSNPEHRNLIAKLRNSISDLNFYAYRFMVIAKLPCTPRTGIHEAIKYSGWRLPADRWPEQLNEILKQYEKIQTATPQTANAIFRETWIFVHDFDHLF